MSFLFNNNDINKKTIDERHMTLDQSRRVLQETRHLVGKLWEEKFLNLHKMFVAFWKQAFRDDKNEILSLVEDKHIAGLNDAIEFGLKVDQAKRRGAFMQVVTTLIDPDRKKEKDGVLWAINQFTSDRTEDQANFRELAEELFLLANLDQAHQKLGNLAKTAEHMARNFS
jgi:hypothetical protein